MMLRKAYQTGSGTFDLALDLALALAVAVTVALVATRLVRRSMGDMDDMDYTRRRYAWASQDLGRPRLANRHHGTSTASRREQWTWASKVETGGERGAYRASLGPRALTSDTLRRSGRDRSVLGARWGAVGRGGALWGQGTASPTQA